MRSAKNWCNESPHTACLLKNILLYYIPWLPTYTVYRSLLGSLFSSKRTNLWICEITSTWRWHSHATTCNTYFVFFLTNNLFESRNAHLLHYIIQNIDVCCAGLWSWSFQKESVAILLSCLLLILLWSVGPPSEHFLQAENPLRKH